MSDNAQRYLQTVNRYMILIIKNTDKKGLFIIFNVRMI